MRRIALISDIHGNVVALRRVLDDIDEAGVHEVYCLGDLVGYGPEPAAVIELIRNRGIPTIIGNYDEGVGNRRGECGCYYSTDQARSDGAASYAFTDSALTQADREWLIHLPNEIRFEYGAARVFLAHGSPRKVNEYLLLDRQDAQLARLADQAQADVICVGHVHIPYHRALTASDGRRVHYVSSGSVGKPKDGDPRAGWVELVLGTEEEVRSTAGDDEAAGPIGHAETCLGALTHRVPYDIEVVADGMAAVGLPPTLIDALMRG